MRLEVLRVEAIHVNNLVSDVLGLQTLLISICFMHYICSI